MSNQQCRIHRALVALSLVLCTTMASAADVTRGIEQALATALTDKRGITLYVGGQTVVGAVTRIEAGQWVELHSQQWGHIIVRIDRIDAVAAL
jgi:hypothetical protein